MPQYAAALTFEDNSHTYEAFSKITNTTGSLGVVTAAVVERDTDGTVKVADSTDSNYGSATIDGSLIGMLIGVLGGPLGMLLGWGVGAAGGSLVDTDRLEQGDDAVSEFANAIPAGRNALIAETNEADTEALDAFVRDLGGIIVRRPMEEVVAELEAQQQAAQEAAKAARKELHAKKKEERKDSFDDRVNGLKSKVSGLKDKVLGKN